MTWVGWLFLLAGLYVLVVVVRGMIQFVSWLLEEYVPEKRSPEHPKEEPSAARASQEHNGPEEHADPKRESRCFAPKTGSQVRKSSRWNRLLKSLKTAGVRKGYDYWVACALSEEDGETKVRHLSRALRLNPAYHPAWGMKGNALFELGRYDEAAECFDQSLQLHPSALVWYRKGLCCHHAGKRIEALRCLDAALEKCPSQDRQLVEDIARTRKLVEDELRCRAAP
jgi:tetratricopeptide (TPR) repeat protein